MLRQPGHSARCLLLGRLLLGRLLLGRLLLGHLLLGHLLLGHLLLGHPPVPAPRRSVELDGARTRRRTGRPRGCRRGTRGRGDANA
jgi:hypothetical protein